MSRLETPADLNKLREQIVAQRNSKQTWLAVCAGTGCRAYGAAALADALDEEVTKRGIGDKVGVRRTGCHGFCERGPLVVIQPSDVCYLGAQIKNVPAIIDSLGSGDGATDKLLFLDEASGKRLAHLDEIPFYKYQKRVLLENNVRIDASNILDYIAVGGYSALAKALSGMTPEAVLSEVKVAGLRGRGGGGFPAGRKWETTRNAHGTPKYVIVNADEGDPGAYMDRSLLEGNPHGVLEGLILGAYAIGSSEGFIYVRQEYPLARKHAQTALEEAREYGLLGDNILGSGFSFDVKIHRGAGAFVSGESSALMCAIEGHVGEPRPKYIHTSEKGIWGKPSCLNNVETWANVPHIINKGSEWFRSMGTEGSKGTKIFSLVGKVCNTGLVEVPMGISLRDIIFKIGGGVPKGKKFKAVQTGGPSGGVIPESLLDLPVDFDELTKVGSMMGSGGMIVMDENTCMVDTARYYTNFLAHESCGKCVPCREGTRQMLNLLNNITSGLGKEGDLDLLEELAEFMESASLCALGQSAPFPVASTLKYFRDEYEEHIKEKRCRAAVCTALIAYDIDQQKCEACGACLRNCPVNAVNKSEDKVFTIIQEKCIKCGACFTACPEKFAAVIKVPAYTIQKQPAGAGTLPGTKA
ncbi:MAG TPA: NADH-ubiquinone oxidoreductase-F iron-sulfur binding region domain-containing protein [Acidobacteriota bacterium]|nr:NADH-ubiquinone oxidoreductase-F iron-sulfur binding region domain-containing protein [Acidobacteriota bacterium]